jgi:hypothetical protein
MKQGSSNERWTSLVISTFKRLGSRRFSRGIESFRSTAGRISRGAAGRSRSVVTASAARSGASRCTARRSTAVAVPAAARTTTTAATTAAAAVGAVARSTAGRSRTATATGTAARSRTSTARSGTVAAAARSGTVAAAARSGAVAVTAASAAAAAATTATAGFRRIRNHGDQSGHHHQSENLTHHVASPCQGSCWARRLSYSLSVGPSHVANHPAYPSFLKSRGAGTQLPAPSDVSSARQGSGGNRGVNSSCREKQGICGSCNGSETWPFGGTRWSVRASQRRL